MNAVTVSSSTVPPATTLTDQDPPPAYTPHTLPPYTHHDAHVDRDHYAISLLMHNLRLDPIPNLVLEEADEVETPDRIQRAAIRDFHASQDPQQWGTRRARGGTQAQPGDGGETTGFWARLLELFSPALRDDDETDRDRARYVSGIPIWVTPNGAI